MSLMTAHKTIKATPRLAAIAYYNLEHCAHIGDK